MFIKNRLRFFLFFFLVLPVFSHANEPLPPSEVLDWLDYALKRFPPDDCPRLTDGTMKCAGVTSVVLSGDLKSGAIHAEFTGYNWSRKEQTVSLLGPIDAFSLQNTSVSLSEVPQGSDADTDFLAPFFDKENPFWKLAIPPGRFVLSASLVFDPKAIMPMTLSYDIGRVKTESLVGGFLQFDDNLGNHGGEVQFVLEGKQKTSEEKPQVRVTRVFTWGSIPTFSYHVSVEGVRTEVPIRVPLLKDEVIESVTPDKPYGLKDGEKRFLEMTVSPATHDIMIKGHYKATPELFSLGEDLPFEVWLHVANKRYPINFETDANPIDPTEFSSFADINNAKAFLVKPSQHLAFLAVNLKVDEGRKGKGKIRYEFIEGADGFWLDKLKLNAEILGQDRLVIPTPKPPIYAGIGNDGIELFRNGQGQLSVRLPSGGLESQPIEVNWHEKYATPAFLGIFSAGQPAQNVFMENQDVLVRFRPGVVPIFAWGAETTGGDLLDQFHLYGFLIGILAFFLCRGLRFSLVLSILVGVLFVGLYLDPTYPTTWVLALLVVTWPLVALKDDSFAGLKKRGWLRFIYRALFLAVCIATLVPLSHHAREWVYQALHPYADRDVVYRGQQQKYKSSGTSQKGDYDQAEDYPHPSPSAEIEDGIANMAGSVMSMPNVAQQMNVPDFRYQNQKMAKKQVSDWNAKPVNILASVRSGREVQFSSYQVTTGQEMMCRILVVGPLLRGLWMLAECGLLLWMMMEVIKRSKRLFVSLE